MQVIQKAFVAEKWVKDARNEGRVKTNLRVEANKALGVAKQENQELTTKLTMEERAWKSAEAGLKKAQDQAKDQHKRLYHTEIELATEKQQVLELKAELQRAKEAARMAKEVAEALEQASYNRGVQETEIRLAEVYRDYYKEVWIEVLNLTGVPATSEWRNAENIFYPEDICEVPAVLPPPVALALLPFE